MDKLSLRKAGPGDSDFVYHVKRAAFRVYVEKVWGWDEVEQRKIHDQRFTAQELQIVHVAGADVGIMAAAAAPDCVHVHQLFILPEHQGRGIGRRCMLLIMDEAREMNLPVRLRVLKVNLRAVAFYERLGFLRTGETDTHHLLEKRP